MSPLEQLKSFVGKSYVDEDGGEYQIELLPPLTETEIDEFKAELPSAHLPIEVGELLRYARGFESGVLGTIQFNGFGGFGLEEYFPYSIPIAGDGYGNFWIIDVSSKGQWKEVYYACHDPPVLVKHSKNLGELLEHIDEYSRLGTKSHLNFIHEEMSHQIYRVDNVQSSQTDELREWLQKHEHLLPERYEILDLKGTANGTGFNLKKYHTDNKVIRLNDEPVWIAEVKPQKGAWTRIKEWIVTHKPTSR